MSITFWGGVTKIWGVAWQNILGVSGVFLGCGGKICRGEVAKT